MLKSKRRKKLLGTTIQKKLLYLIFACASVPTAIVMLALYYIMAWQVALEYNFEVMVRHVHLTILIAIPIVFLFIWLVALELSHRIAGPLFRLERELDDRITGKEQGPIKLRHSDEFKVLVEKINKFLEKK